MHVLVTGATGKVGRAFIEAFLASGNYAHATVRALCHNRTLPERDRLNVVKGSIADRDAVRAAMDGITHVVHLATCKETPEDVVSVSIGGLFWLLEEARQSAAFKRFLLIAGDSAIGHFFTNHGAPITETAPHRAYAGCYALSKVLEEVMVTQSRYQYGLDTTLLRAPWIMEKDDFRCTLSFGDDQFGGPVWRDLVSAKDAQRYHAAQTTPVLHDVEGRPMRRNFVHLSDLVSAMLIALTHERAGGELFNICMTRPVDYGEVADYLHRTRGFERVDIASEHYSNWMSNAKARHFLDWSPQYDLERLIEEAWTYERASDDQRRVWYPG